MRFEVISRTDNHGYCIVNIVNVDIMMDQVE